MSLQMHGGIDLMYNFNITMTVSKRLGLSCIASLSQIALHVATINHPIIECHPWLLKK